MITKAEREKLLALIENCCVYEGQVALWDHLRPTQIEPASRDLVTTNYERSLKNADEAGQALIAFIEEITEKSDETD